MRDFFFILPKHSSITNGLNFIKNAGKLFLTPNSLYFVSVLVESSAGNVVTSVVFYWLLISCSSLLNASRIYFLFYERKKSFQRTKHKFKFTGLFLLFFFIIKRKLFFYSAATKLYYFHSSMKSSCHPILHRIGKCHFSHSKKALNNFSLIFHHWLYSKITFLARIGKLKISASNQFSGLNFLEDAHWFCKFWHSILVVNFRISFCLKQNRLGERSPKK